ncbi:MAG: DegT/DnrJ/EryC1/StrS family aminotransferase, partial [Bacteroidota bacterium]
MNKRQIPLMIPSVNEDDINCVVNVLRSGQLIQGKEVEALEATIASYTGTAHAICVSNGTATLHLSLLALGIGKGDEVIIPAFSYIATANVVELVGATPVFVDIDLATFNIDETRIEEAITPKTKAIMPVQEFGLISNMEAIMQLAQQHKLYVIEDAACALGAQQNNKAAGSFGHLGSFSLHPRKAITSGEGGIITTNNKQLADKLRILRNHGIDYSTGSMDFVEAG